MATQEPPRDLFRMRRVFALERSADAAIEAMAVHSRDRRELLALAVASSRKDAPAANFVLVRSVEEDLRPRTWRFPLAASRAKQQQQRTECVVALEFSPEGDWLACLSSRKNRLHVLPVAKLIAAHRRTRLYQAYQPAHNHEWMSVRPSVMTAQMASFLRATNEGGGLNGARYNSTVAGDDEQMSTLAFAIGMGTVTCCRWWRSMNGRNYCLVGGTERIVSIVNIEDNTEECRCELQNAGAIVSIDLFVEKFRKEKRTSMLIKTRMDDRSIKYYRVVLEKRKTKSQRAKTEDDEVKTFPDHFLQDADFRPQRIKKNSPALRLCAVNGALLTESSLAVFDPDDSTVSLYSNFQWNLKGQFRIPRLHSQSGSTLSSVSDAFEDIDLSYCSSDLMLLQGKTADSKSISTWVSLPSRQGSEQLSDEAQIVHMLRLHGDERIERVVQITAEHRRHHESEHGADVGVLYVMQTRHHVYECQPQWSRLALFAALRGQTITLRDALSIGFALGVDMASLCEVVADTLCSDVAQSQIDGGERLQQWVHDLYEISRVLPSKAVEKLFTVGNTALAIAFGKRALASSQEETVHGCDRALLALQVVEHIFQYRLQNTSASDMVDQRLLQSQEPRVRDQLKQDEEWLMNFLATNADYTTEPMVDLCLTNYQIEKAIHVAISRSAVALVLRRVIARGLAVAFSEPSARLLVSRGFAKELVHVDCRILLRSLPTAFQAEIIVAYPPCILLHRDWIVRELVAIPTSVCRQLAILVDPRTESRMTPSPQTPESSKPSIDEAQDEIASIDVDSSEQSSTPIEGQWELFLTLLLRLNSRDEGKSCNDAQDSEYSQVALEHLLRGNTTKYRPPVMVSRCMDFCNWAAAACIYEVMGEHVESVECQLEALRASNPVVDKTVPPKQKPAPAAGAIDTEQELARLMSDLVVSPVWQVDHSRTTHDDTRLAILARLVARWSEFSLDQAALEGRLTDPAVFGCVAPLLVRLLFANLSAPGSVNSSDLTCEQDAQVDRRDHAWLHRCRALSFSGNFMFLVCKWALGVDDDATATTNTSGEGNDIPTTLALDSLRDNIAQNDLAVSAVRIVSLSARALGKSDPLETHVKAFTCGHVFPRRIFEEDVLPEFDKRMNALAMPLFTTKQALLHEFRRNRVEAPCPVCSFNKISKTVSEQMTHNAATAAATTASKHKQPSEYDRSAHARLYFLHGEPPAMTVPTNRTHNFEPWEWKGPALV